MKLEPATPSEPRSAAPSRLLCYSPKRQAAAGAEPSADRQPRTLSALSASGTQPDSLWERSCGHHPVSAANLPERPGLRGVFKQLLVSIVFPGNPGHLQGGEGRPAPQTAAPACPPLICISKANFCRTSPEATAPTGFARVVVLLQLLLRALLAFQSRIVRGDVQALLQPPSAAGQRQQQQQ